MIHPLHKFIKVSGLFLMLSLSFLSCRKEVFETSSDAKLSFSVDTLLFDTLFTTIGSVTKSFMVYNPHKNPVIISSITLASGKASDFKINIDGTLSERIEDYEIEGKDSIYIFVEALIDATSNNTPFLVSDSVIFITNKNKQDVKLVAYGQDAHFHYTEELTTQNWTNDKPHVIINGSFVPENETLTIEEGTKVYLSKTSSLVVEGTLNITGSIQNPVTIQGMRLEEFYRDIPGQWGAIALISNNEHHIENAIIKNGVAGIQLGYYPDTDLKPKLKLINTQIENMSFAGIYSFGASITGYNCVVADCKTYAIALLRGGESAFYHTTIGNFYSHGIRNQPSVVITNFFEDDTMLVVQDLINATFTNSIIYGSSRTEIGYGNVTEVYDDAPVSDFNFNFNHCILKVDTEETTIDLSDNTFFTEIINTSKFKFASGEDPDDEDYYEVYKLQIDSTSTEALKAGDVSFVTNHIELQNDMLGNPRSMSENPDLGAYVKK